VHERDDADDELTTHARPRVQAPAADSRFAIVVADGPERGASVTLDTARPSPLLVGSSPACDLRLTDRHVSRRHATLEVAEDRVRVVDLGSMNGSFVGDVAIVDAYARAGETLRVGSTTLRIDRLALGPAAPLPTASRFGRTLGSSTAMRRLYPLCERLASSMVPVIIEGETGTGKEVLAESLHEQGPRAQGPFVVFDCTAVPPNLVEAELFGHERGAFTGAVGARRGVFEQAHGGTLFIDEIGDLDLALQPKLLRAIERSEVRRIGSDRTMRVDVRLLCATRRDLDREVARQRFRDDLFHRLAVARVELPPLRRRAGDVAVLARHFCRELGGDEHAVQAGLVVKWEGYTWPGNVRELRNLVARWLAIGDLEMVSVDDGAEAAGAASAPLSSPAAMGPAAPPGGDPFDRVLALKLPLIAARQRIVEQFERRYIQQVLAEQGGNVARAAAASGIARRHFQRLRARGR
jgi:DNA-binding NtrC family response regulator